MRIKKADRALPLSEDFDPTSVRRVYFASITIKFQVSSIVFSFISLLNRLTRNLMKSIK